MAFPLPHDVLALRSHTVICVLACSFHLLEALTKVTHNRKMQGLEWIQRIRASCLHPSRPLVPGGALHIKLQTGVGWGNQHLGTEASLFMNDWILLVFIPPQEKKKGEMKMPFLAFWSTKKPKAGCWISCMSVAGPQAEQLPASWLPQEWQTLKEMRVLTHPFTSEPTRPEALWPHVSLPLYGDGQFTAGSPAESHCRPFMGPESPVLSSQ